MWYVYNNAHWSLSVNSRADNVTWWHIAQYSSQQNACIAVNSDKTIITSFTTAYVLITGGMT